VKGKFPASGPRAGKSYVWPEEEIDACLENTRAAFEEAMARQEAIGRIPNSDDQVSDD
jgi:hypothetical protein